MVTGSNMKVKVENSMGKTDQYEDNGKLGNNDQNQ